MKTALFLIEGMSCQHCVMAVRRALEKLPVESMDIQMGQAEVVFDETILSTQRISLGIEDAGYTVQAIR